MYLTIILRTPLDAQSIASVSHMVLIIKLTVHIKTATHTIIGLFSMFINSGGFLVGLQVVFSPLTLIGLL